MLDRALLPANASIRAFQQGKAGYVADVVEQALLLPEDMADLRSIRRHEVFLNQKRDLAMAVQATFQAEEITNFCHQQMKEEEGRRNAAVEAFNLAEKRINEMKDKLSKVERDKKSAEAALDSIERQAEGQRVLLRQAENQLAASKGQIAALKKKLEEAEKARE